MNFTKTQISALVAKTNFEGTVEEYAAQMGFTIAEIATPTANKKAGSRAALQGKTSIVLVHSAQEGEFLFTTNKGFAGRTEAWVLADWRKTVKTSRESFKACVNAEDAAVTALPPQANVTAEDIAQLHVDTAHIVAEFINAGYNCLTKIPREVREVLDTLLTQEEATEEAQAETVVKTIPTHYSAVQGATGCLEKAKKPNAKRKAGSSTLK